MTTFELFEGAIPDMSKMAKIAVEREIKGRPDYCCIKRDLAIKAIEDYREAYIQTSDYSDQWGSNACIWANGGLLGLPNLDPPLALSGLRAVLNWRQRELPAEEFDRWMRHVVKVLKPINAMAEIDTEVLKTERGLSDKDFQR